MSNLRHTRSPGTRRTSKRERLNSFYHTETTSRVHVHLTQVPPRLLTKINPPGRLKRRGKRNEMCVRACATLTMKTCWENFLSEQKTVPTCSWWTTSESTSCRFDSSSGKEKKRKVTHSANIPKFNILPWKSFSACSTSSQQLTSWRMIMMGSTLRSGCLGLPLDDPLELSLK